MGESARTVPGGLVVFFEGIDGIGKTTQLEQAADNLRADGWLIHTTRGHGGTPFGEELREISFKDIERAPETNLYLSMAIHNELGAQAKKWREEGAITLIDRGPLSMAAYQIYGDGCDPGIGWREVEADVERFSPELMILYTAAIDVARTRAASRGGKRDFFEKKPRGYFERVDEGFAESSRRFGAHCIDADRSIEAIHEDTLAAIRQAIAARV